MTATMVRFHEEDVIDTLRQVLGLNTDVQLTSPCRCCNAVIGYARDSRALWIFPQLWPTVLPPGFVSDSQEIMEASLKYEPRVIGFETSAELEQFLSKLTGKNDYAAFADTLRSAFAEGSN